jgi:hypothetical protein
VAAAGHFATILPFIALLQKAGVASNRGIATALYGRGVRTAHGGRWQVSNVRNLLGRVLALNVKSRLIGRN